ncbi:aminotransferase class III-fold pyridoxal phosphate-dependent enzyme [bacterium]|nr:aminotransferase class III-fold pyridoxal phosphate-dependent enzyme [bacterium]
MNPNFLEFSQQISAALQGCDGIRAADPNKKMESDTAIHRMGEIRGRPLLFPMMPTGRASGPYIEMMDGSVKLDMITGIGVSLFGHNHPTLMLTALKKTLKAPTMQGTLMPGKEAMECSELLVRGARGELAGQKHLSDEAKSEVAQCWLTTCGSMANELALKICRQKKAPAYKAISFRNCFAGRSSTMGELTDEPKYRVGQPTFDQFSHVDFYDDQVTVDDNIATTKRQFDEILSKDAELYSTFVFEPVQGEGGAFRQAPREWWVAILEYAKSKGLAIWLDEVQTFGRTGELYAFQRLEIGKYVDVVTVAKPLHAAAVLWTDEYKPQPGLIAGTFAASGACLAMGAKTIEMLSEDGYLGPSGKIQELERFIIHDWNKRREIYGEKFGFGKMNIIGGMIAMEVLDGQAETIKSLLLKMFDAGVLGFSAGKAPVCLRFLPAVGVIKESHWLETMEVLEKVLLANEGEFSCVSSS